MRSDMPRPHHAIVFHRNNLRAMRLVIHLVAIKFSGTMVDRPRANLSEERRRILEGILRVDWRGVGA